MKVLLIDVDSKVSNLALMKISAYHKAKGDIVGFNVSNPDKVYISCIFSNNRKKALGIAKMFNCEVEVGGYGVSLTKKLPDEIEHICPDYNLYKMDYSLGYTSRGCIRNCPWCLIPKAEGSIKEWSPLKEFVRHDKVMLLDPNFLASHLAIEKLKQIYAWKLKVCFNQGLDIRLIDQENAKLLSKIRYMDDQFKNRRLYFAFDLPNIEDQVIKGVEILKKAGIPPKHLMFYILVGFNTTFEEDYHRFEVIKNLGALPYIMIYNKLNPPKQLTHFQRWVNRRYYQFLPFEKYLKKGA